MSIDPEDVAERLAVVRSRIVDAGGDPDAVRVCAVTKGFDLDAVVAAVSAGLHDIGENYAQELLGKVQAAGELPELAEVRWHMIGQLQRNKVKGLAGAVHCWQTIDRTSVATEVASRSPGARVMVQVAGSSEPGKGGCDPDQVPALVEHSRGLGLDVVGLMTVGPTDASADPRPTFDAVTALADRLQLPERSMGMSRDLEAAVAGGATMVRVGTGLFGPRRPRAPSVDS